MIKIVTHRILVKNNGNCRKIPVTDILFIESNNKKIMIHTADETVEYYQKMEDITEELGSSFFRCHRCYTVNMEFVIGYNSMSIQLQSGKSIPLARRRRALFAEEFEAYNKSVKIT